MTAAYFQVYPDLNAFLSHDRREGIFVYHFDQGQSIKHLMEAAGIPHTEAGALEVNGLPVGFDYQLRQDDRVAVYPASAENNPAPGTPRFVLDNHLGRLAAYLRMLGFDTDYRNDFDDNTLAEISGGEERILLTRDRRLLMRKAVRYGYCPRSLDPYQQVMEVLRRYGLASQITPFRRCLRCNGLLQPVRKEDILDQLEPLTRQYYDEFHRCPACGQVYWKGSHYQHMQSVIDQLRGVEPQPSDTGKS
jgi:uncharacterized protein with PIN domain